MTMIDTAYRKLMDDQVKRREEYQEAQKTPTSPSREELVGALGQAVKLSENFLSEYFESDFSKQNPLKIDAAQHYALVVLRDLHNRACQKGEEI